ncbi:MAG: threonine/serine exporter family protein [Lachnospiraceae bacterium]
MDRNEADEYLYCAMDIGQMLLQSGAEVNRVEDTVARIMSAAGVPGVEVFSITSTVTATAHIGEFQTITQMRRIYGVTTNMQRISELNQLSRDICSQHLKPATIRARISEIRAEKPINSRIMILGYALVSGAFALFFGGDMADCIASAVIGALLYLFERFLVRLTSNHLMTALLWSAMGGLLAQIAVSLGLGHHADMISIGNIMLYIPGVAFTNSIRDLFIGDTITGVIRFLESLLLTGIIAVGFTVAGRLF